MMGLRAIISAASLPALFRPLQLALAAAFVRQSNVLWAALVACTIALQVWLAATRSGQAERLLSHAGLQALLSSWRPLVTRLLPFALLGAAAVAFVALNGGVVVGDKASHAPVLHLAQLGYACGIWALYLVGGDGADIALRLLVAGRHALTPQQEAWLQCLGSWLGLEAGHADHAVPAKQLASSAAVAAAASSSTTAADAADTDAPELLGSTSRSGPRSRGRAGSHSRKHGEEGQVESTTKPSSLSSPLLPASPAAGKPRLASDAVSALPPQQLRPLPTQSASQSPRVAFRATVLAAAVAVAAGLIDTFTFEHEYLLADNRHYTFYLWRRIMQPRRWLRAGLAVVYVAGAVLLAARIVSASWLYIQRSNEAAATAGSTAAAVVATAAGDVEIKRHGDGSVVPTVGAAPGQPEAATATELAAALEPLTECTAEALTRSAAAQAAVPLQREAAGLWFAAFFVATALAVVPSRLLEPRYFILPTIIALLNAPPVSSNRRCLSWLAVQQPLIRSWLRSILERCSHSRHSCLPLAMHPPPCRTPPSPQR